MAKSLSVLKTIRQTRKRRERNRYLKARIRGIIKKFMKAESVEEKKKLLPQCYALIDKGVSKGILHRNTAARKKSKLAKLLNELEKKG